jgi:hypothetical protein
LRKTDKASNKIKEFGQADIKVSDYGDVTATDKDGNLVEVKHNSGTTIVRD